MIKIEIPKDDLYIPVENVDRIPKKIPGIYKFYGEDGTTLMYIGKTADLRDRISKHLSSKDQTSYDIYHNFYYIACLFVEDEVDREIYETYMINVLKPLLNWKKVYTYQSQKYNPKYNPLEQKKKEEIESRYKKSMIKFGGL